MDRDELLYVHGGDGTLTLLRGDGDTALLVDGHPVVLAWSEPSEDVPARAFLRAFDLGVLDETAGPLDLSRGELHRILHPVLARLADGAWRVVVQETPDVLGGPACRDGDPDEDAGGLVAWAGLHRVRADDQLLVGTVPRDLVADRVGALVRCIQQGGRPAVVALACPDDDLAFVVAGHAAMIAWRRLGLPPLLVRLEPVAPGHLSPDHESELVGDACERVGELLAAHRRAVRTEALRKAAGS